MCGASQRPPLGSAGRTRRLARGCAVRPSEAARPPAPAPAPSPSDASNAVVLSPQSAWCQGAHGQVPDQVMLTSAPCEPPSLWGYCGVLVAHVPADSGTSLGPRGRFAEGGGAHAPLALAETRRPPPAPPGDGCAGLARAPWQRGCPSGRARTLRYCWAHEWGFCEGVMGITVFGGAHLTQRQL